VPGRESPCRIPQIDPAFPGHSVTANLKGALWIVCSCAAATVMTVGVRELSATIQSMETAFARSAVGLVVIAPFVVTAGVRTLRSRRWPLHLFRGLLGVGAVNLGFYALSKLPLATATVLFFTAPLFVTVFAGPLLGETIGWRRWCATAVGFLGTAVVVRPGTAGFDPDMLVPIASSVVFALILIVGKRLSTTETPVTMMAYASAVAALGTLPPALLVWVPPSPSELLLMLLVGVFGTARTYFDIRGYAAGEASFVAPFQYTRILFVALAAYLVFAELPSATDGLGAAIIISATLYTAHREARLARARRLALGE